MVSYLFDQLASCHLDQWIEFAIAKGVESLSDKLFYTFPCLLVSPGGQKTSSTNLKHLHLRLCILDVPGPSFKRIQNPGKP